MCKYNFFFIRTFVEQCSAAMACILDDFGLPSDCVVVVFVVLHLVRVRWGAKFQPLSHGKRKKNVLRLLRMLALARRLYDFSNNLHDSFFIPHFKEGGFFYFHSCSLFSLFKITFAFVWMLFVCVLFRR